MLTNSPDNQSRAAVLASALIMLLLALACLYKLYDGPNRDSALLLFRYGFLHYPAMLLSAILFGGMAWLRIKRFRAQQGRS